MRGLKRLTVTGKESFAIFCRHWRKFRAGERQGQIVDDIIGSHVQLQIRRACIYNEEYWCGDYSSGSGERPFSLGIKNDKGTLRKIHLFSSYLL